MPNTPAMIGMGMTVWTSVSCSDEQNESARKLLASAGDEVSCAQFQLVVDACPSASVDMARVHPRMDNFVGTGSNLRFMSSLKAHMKAQFHPRDSESPSLCSITAVMVYKDATTLAACP